MDMSYEDLEVKGFDTAQINQILNARKKGLDFSELNIITTTSTMRKIIELEPKIDAKKMSLLAKCIQNDYDISYVLDNKYNYKQAAQIVDGMFKNINYKLYANPTFSSNVMKSIKKGLIHGLDESLIRSPILTSKTATTFITLALESKKVGFDLEKFVQQGYNIQQISTLLYAHKQGINMEKYITPEFTCDQLDGVFKCLSDNKHNGLDIDIEQIAQKTHSKKKMLLLYNLAKDGYPIKTLIDKNYTRAQLNLIRVGIEKDIDYKMYWDPKFQSKQMSEILNGLISGIDVSCYADPKYTASQMNAFLKVLKANQEGPDVVDINLLLHTEYPHYKIMNYASKLRNGTLDEKLKIIRQSDLLSKQETENIKEDIDR